MSLTDKKIDAVFILEILGRPPEFLISTLNDLIKKMGEEKGIKIKESKINTPVLLKDQKDFYTSFAEIEFEAETMLNVVILMFKYMPAHVEIISPQNASMTNAEWGDILSELTRRLHGYEEIARIMQNEKIILENKLREVMEIKKGKEETRKEEKVIKSKKSKKK